MRTVFLLPNGMTSDGSRIVKMTKAQRAAARTIARMPKEQREEFYGYVDALVQNPPKPPAKTPKWTP